SARGIPCSMTLSGSSTEIERQVRWLMTLRGVTVTTLLVCAFGVELLLRPIETLRPLFTLAAVAYGMVLLYAVLYRWLSGTRFFVVLQLVGDAVIVTFFVGITGGIDSPMSFLYLLPIAVASLLLYRSGGLALAAVCWGFYAASVLGLDVSPVSGSLSREPAHVVYVLVAHLVGMLACAVLSSHLAERMRAQGRELAERRGAVARLKALNENIIESINSGLVTTDLSGRITFINRGGTEILRDAAERFDGRSIESVFRLEPGFLDEIREKLTANLRFRFEQHHQTPDGATIFLGIAASNLHDRQGNPLGYIFIFQDLTEIHALEQEMRLKERMVALGEMAAGMAHELRNPLAAISGSVQYLKGDLRPSGETLELMDIILRESQRLDQAIKDFLTFARPGTFAPETVDLVRLIEDHVKLLKKSREFTPSHAIETDYPTATVVCEADPNRLKQVCWNLAINALKAMPDGGKLTIRVALADGGRRLDISFSDEGQGMTEEDRERYFQPFSGSFRQGTGLGAAIVYRLVEEHRGRIVLDSAAGRGTCVTITLPRYTITRTEQAAPKPQLRAAGG
ncbi:MAG TPA: ATP-binding protein, partial [Candidatus Polarisedimenticolaceae bacterium]|nr:ATP-binding protein [Candidatus Polarisedimenticolaceae bacterium]